MEDTVRMVMVGKTGVGKSSAGNTILSSKKFEAMTCASSVTRQCQLVEHNVHGYKVSLVDTPGLFDTSVPEDVIEREIGKCVHLLTPGPHVFLIVVAAGRFTKEEQTAVDVVKQIFGADISKFAIVVLTRGDDLKADSLTAEDYLEQSGQKLRSLIDQCGGRVHALDNRDQDPTQVLELMEKVQALVRKNKRCYTSALFEAAIKIRELKQELEKAKKHTDSKVYSEMMLKMQKQMLEFQSQLINSRERVCESKKEGSCSIA